MFQSGCEPGVAVAAARESGARERGESDQASKTTPSHVGLGTLAPFLASRHPHPHPRYKAVSSQRTAHTTHHASLRLASARVRTLEHTSHFFRHTPRIVPQPPPPEGRPPQSASPPRTPHPSCGRVLEDDAAALPSRLTHQVGRFGPKSTRAQYERCRGLRVTRTARSRWPRRWRGPASTPYARGWNPHREPFLA